MVPQGDTVLGTYGGSSLPCGIAPGDQRNLAVSGPTPLQLWVMADIGSDKQVDDATSDAAAGHDAYLCDVSSQPFSGFWPGGSTTAFTKSTSDYASYGTVPKLSSGAYSGNWVGLVPTCAFAQQHGNPDGVCDSPDPQRNANNPAGVILSIPSPGMTRLSY